jgi:hypothetical protein
VPSIYSDDPSDAWNRTFSLLFTRTIQTRMTNEFPDAGPFTRPARFGGFAPETLRISTRLFERFEEGDRALEPFYPSFGRSQRMSYGGLNDVGNNTLVAQLEGALNDALNERTVRPPLDRVLMQVDLWAAYDTLAPLAAERSRRSDLRAGALRLLPPLARFIKKIALTSREIDGLPDNYRLAATRSDLPDLFASDSGWMEIVWFDSQRIHEDEADNRQATRVFVKPATRPVDQQQFVDGLRREGNLDELSGVALVMQALAIDSGGHVVPTPLVSTVQVRMFAKDDRGMLRMDAREDELSRRKLRTSPATGGLVSIRGGDPAYLPNAGNGYGFALPLFDVGSPVLGTLRTRCGSCHSGGAVTTFNVVRDYSAPLPTVAILPQSNDTRARVVAARKMQSEDFRSLRAQTRP